MAGLRVGPQDVTSVRMRNLFLIYSLEINVFRFAKTDITIFKFFSSTVVGKPQLHWLMTTDLSI